MMLDDDTYYNIPHIIQYLTFFQHKTYQESQDDSLIMTGCIIRGKLPPFTWTFPFGGWGTIFSRGALETIMTPLHCNNTNTKVVPQTFKDVIEESPDGMMDRMSDICYRLQKDRIGEYQTYRDGFSLSDVMNAYVFREAYVDQAQWSLGFCLHSDWIWGCKLFLRSLLVVYVVALCYCAANNLSHAIYLHARPIIILLFNRHGQLL